MVTGAAHGTGQAIAAGLAERGTRIVLGDIDDVSETSDLIGATGHPMAAELQNVRPGRPVSRIPLDATRRPHRTSGSVASRSAEPTAN
jgi:NAD(P)-dependent dehydrogenase (short-subunit alcohol dehydrogenase family)